MASLTIDSQSFDIEGAWKHNRSLRRLRSTIATRGQNRRVPGTAGVYANPVRRDEVIVDLELMVFGRNNAAGTPYANVLAGLDENLLHLEDFVLDHTDGTTAAWPAVLETASGRTFETDVQILNWQIAQENAVQVVITYDLRIPSGRWTEIVGP